MANDSTALPDDVRAALLGRAKYWLLNNYVGGKKRLEAWNDHYAFLTSITSTSFPGPTYKSLHRLVRLVENGALLERPRYRFGGLTRSFTAPRPALDEIGLQAVRELEIVGYRIGMMMPEIKEPTQ